MNNIVLTDEKLRRAAIAYGEALCADKTVYDPGHVFSERYNKAISKMLETSRRRKAVRRRVMNSVAAAVCMIVVFGAILASSPKAYAAFQNWTLNISNKLADYQFDHSQDDHAAIICEPAYLPGSFEKTDTYHSGYYTRKNYRDSATGTWIRFEYRKPTESQKNSIQKRSASAEDRKSV